jgi:hypothetical protein
VLKCTVVSEVDALHDTCIDAHRALTSRAPEFIRPSNRNSAQADGTLHQTSLCAHTRATEYSNSAAQADARDSVTLCAHPGH